MLIKCLRLCNRLQFICHFLSLFNPQDENFTKTIETNLTKFLKYEVLVKKKLIV
ncbi:hypothetical protein SAMN05660903_01783 [Salegentibacter salinarum]|nr:hypothetical protein SAMN05660903_01783 [Salegentibacter salinarum]